MNSPIKNVIFDLDGTLIDSSDGVVEAVNYSLRQVGDAERTADEIKPFIGYPLHDMYQQFSRASIEELYRHFRTIANTRVPELTTALPGADATLRKLHEAGYRLAVATTKVRVNIDAILDKLRWQDLFAATIGGDEVPRLKPEPDAFRAALTMLGVSNGEALVVGDTVNDVRAAQAVPVRVAAIRSPYGGEDELKALKPDYYIESIDQLFTILE